MMTDFGKRYHHGHLDRAGIDGAVEEVEAVGVAAVSMRRIARRAGVSHAALPYRFGDKTGIFTAVAAEGFRLVAAVIRTKASGPDAFVRAGLAYITFALTHRGYFEVMFRPNLHRGGDTELEQAKAAAFDVLYGSARTSLEAHRQAPVSEDDVRGLALAGWSVSHGFATLALAGSLSEQFEAGTEALTALIGRGTVVMGELAEGAQSSGG